jgi:hypothetical protein
VVGLFALAGCGTGSMILWNPRTGLCDEVPTAAACALGGVLFAATQDVDKWGCEGLKAGDTARTEKRPRPSSIAAALVAASLSADFLRDTREPILEKPFSLSVARGVVKALFREP